MFYLMIVVFVLGYLCIALEHPLGINKSATALLLGATMWVLFILGDYTLMPVAADFQAFQATHPNANYYTWLTHGPLLEHLGEISEILFFLIGAMTIVELIETHQGFRVVTDQISTTKKSTLLWIISFIAFFLSAVLDNLTTSIVMVALLRKLIANKQDRWFFAGMVVLAANAGGAWSPIGDVTTIMLWIAGKVSALNIIKMTFFASLVSIVVPLCILSFKLRGRVSRPKIDSDIKRYHISLKESNLFFFLGLGLLLAVPVFKTVTHLPPYVGILTALGIMWIVSDLTHRKRTTEEKHHFSVTSVLTRIDLSSMLFFLGILLAVAALQTCGQLELLSASLENIPMNEPEKYYLITAIIGLFSSIVDNVPLVAGAMGMYNFPMDHYFWEFLAYAAGTGGSILIIGSAAGVAVMGMEKIDFIWYLKKISLLALIGYMAGCGTFILQKTINQQPTVTTSICVPVQESVQRCTSESYNTAWQSWVDSSTIF